MSRRRRSQGSTAEAGEESKSAVDPALAAFADFVRTEEAKDREARRAQREERNREREARKLVDEKDRAAAELKRLSTRSGVSAEERSRAEATYRAALAAVIAAETGEAPTWAPEGDDAAETEANEPGTAETSGTSETDEAEADGAADISDDANA